MAKYRVDVCPEQKSLSILWALAPPRTLMTQVPSFQDFFPRTKIDPVFRTSSFALPLSCFALNICLLLLFPTLLSGTNGARLIMQLGGAARGRNLWFRRMLSLLCRARRICARGSQLQIQSRFPFHWRTCLAPRRSGFWSWHEQFLLFRLGCRR